MYVVAHELEDLYRPPTLSFARLYEAINVDKDKLSGMYIRGVVDSLLGKH